VVSESKQSTALNRSASLEEACDRFLDDIKVWAHACIDKYEAEAPTDGHDQLTYTTGWEPYLLARTDNRVIRFLEKVQEDVAEHHTLSDKWFHGYWRTQEAHHGTEHFELFLGFMARVLPGNPTTSRQIVDAVEHLGNWSDEVPPWFDHSTGVFRSLFYGTAGGRDRRH